MQKKLIALAVAGLVAAPAFAQSNVTMYGRLDYGYLNQSEDAWGTDIDASSTGFGTGALTTSRLGFKGTEDLGNGLKAFFQLELQIADTSAFGDDTGANLGDSFDTRLSLVGLSGSFGSVTLGRQYTAVETAWGIGAAGAINNAIGSLYTSGERLSGRGLKQNNTRSDELITYMSPDMSGVKVAVQYGKGTTDSDAVAGETSQKEMGFSVTYANGPLNVGLGYSKESGETLGVDSNSAKSLVLGGNYDFGVVKLFGTYMRGSNDDQVTNIIGFGNYTTDKVKGWELGLNAPVGPVVLVASYFDANGEYNHTTNSALDADVDYKGYQLGALYPLSKRTIVYALYGHQNEEIDGVSDDDSIRQIAIGVRHDF
jgi:predicted porin